MLPHPARRRRDIFIVNSGKSDFYTPWLPLKKSHDMREVLGVGPATKIDWIESMAATSGHVERFTDVPIDRYVIIVERNGKIET